MRIDASVEPSMQVELLLPRIEQLQLLLDALPIQNLVEKAAPDALITTASIQFHEDPIEIENTLESVQLPEPVLTVSMIPDVLLPVEQGEHQPQNISGANQSEDAGVSTSVEIIGDISPRYPALSRRRGEHGLVVLEVHVLKTGNVDDVRVLRHPGHRRLVDAAIEAVRVAKFEPAAQHGEPVAAWLRVPVRFVIE